MPLLLNCVPKAVARAAGNVTDATVQPARTADVLLRILKRDAESEVLVGMSDETELSLPRPDQTGLIVRVHVLGVEDVGRQRRQDLSVGSEQTPILAAQNFEGALLHVDEDVAHAERIGVAGDEHVRGLVAQEVGFEVAEHLCSQDI